MDFELISGPGAPARQPLRELEFFFLNRKRQWQVWLSHPPYLLGGIIFGSVVFELFLARLLETPASLGDWPGRIFATAAVLFLILAAMVLVSGQIADLFEKKGSPVVALSLLAVSLAPLLLLLPITIGIRLAGLPGAYSFLALLVLGASVLSLWREALEAAYKFSRFQSAAVLYSSFSLAVAVIVFIAYVFLVTQLNQALDGLI